MQRPHSSPETLRLGVIGLGRAAALMIPGLAGHPHVRLTAAADPNAGARARFEIEFGGTTFEDAETLCAGDLVDAVYVATPHADHVHSVSIAAGYGKHVIVEKPMALTLADCRRITAVTAEAGVALVVGHTHAFNAPTALMAELVRSGELGRLRMIVNLVYTNWLYRPRRAEELDSALGGGIMFNQVPHQIELVRALSNLRVERVRAVTGIWDPDRNTEGALAAFLTLAGGAVAQLTYSAYDHFDSDELHWWIAESGGEKAPDQHGAARRELMAVAGTARERERRQAMGVAGGAASGSRRMHEPHFGFLLATCERGDLRPSPDGVLVYGDGGVREHRVPAPRGYPNRDRVIDELYAAVFRGERPVHDGEWGMATLAVVLALIESARTQSEVLVEYG